MQTCTKSWAVKNGISTLRTPQVWILTSTQCKPLVTVEDHIEKYAGLNVLDLIVLNQQNSPRFTAFSSFFNFRSFLPFCSRHMLDNTIVEFTNGPSSLVSFFHSIVIWYVSLVQFRMFPAFRNDLSSCSVIDERGRSVRDLDDAARADSLWCDTSTSGDTAGDYQRECKKSRKDAVERCYLVACLSVASADGDGDKCEDSQTGHTGWLRWKCNSSRHMYHYYYCTLNCDSRKRKASVFVIESFWRISNYVM